MNEHHKLGNGRTIGEWADKRLADGTWDACIDNPNRQELIKYAINQIEECERINKISKRSFKEQCESIEGGLGAGA